MKEFLTSLLLAVVTAAVPVLTTYAIGYIRQAGARAQANTDDLKKQSYIKEITDAITDAVASTSQTFVDSLKKAGNFTEDKWAEASQKALEACLASISPAAKAFAEAAYGDINAYLKTKIEAEVRKQKKEAPAASAQAQENTAPDAKAIAATCAAATAAAVTQVAINQTATGQPPATEQQNQ